MELDALKILAEQALALSTQHGEVVESLIRRDDRSRVRLDVGVDGGDEPVELCHLEKGAVEPDFDVAEVEGVVAELDGPAAQVVGDAVTVTLEGKGRGFGDLALVAVSECLAQLGGIDGPGGRDLVLPVVG
jgi:hypothetical protein